MKREFDEKGFLILESIYSKEEIDAVLADLDAKDISGQFGVREFLLHNKDIATKLFTTNLREVIKAIAPNCNKSIKSIYFDKPPNANWIVNWHQDLTINLVNRMDVDQYKNWRETKERVVVQPNRELLERIFTIRIHLDDCTKENGALNVIESSHARGPIDIKEWAITKEGRQKLCEVKKGGILLMKPLILHSSSRTENEKNRRVIHIEFTDQELPEGLQWKEMIEFDSIMID